MKQNLEQLWEIYSAKMKTLMEQLPEMEQLSLCCSRMQTAAKAIKQASHLQMLLEEQKHLQQEAAKYQEAGNQGLSAYIQNQMGYRQGPVKEQKTQLQKLLAQGGFADVSEAEAFLAGPESAEELQKRIQAFQKEYAETLAKCREIDAQLPKPEES